MKKRILSFALTLVMIVALLSVATSTAIAAEMPIAQANGFIAPIDNTVPSNAIRISTAAELAEIGGTQSAGMYYVLANSITLTTEWIPIPDFHGTFDGQGNTINNLYILSSSNRQYVGLFAQASEHATIKNVGVNIGLLGVSANQTSRQTHSYSGGLIGQNNGTSISNCYVIGSIYAATSQWRSPTYAGGLVGENNNGAISTSYTTGTVSASPTDGSSHAYAGGLIGLSNNGTIGGCFSSSNVTATSIGTGNLGGPSDPFAGGLVGYCRGDTIVNSYATGTVSASAHDSMGGSGNYSISYAGGLIGAYSGGVATNCFSTGTVSASISDSARISYAGGLTAYLKDAALTNCYTTGKVSAFDSSSSFTSSSYAGGLTAFCDNGIIVITNCYAKGVITAEGRSPQAGGLITVNVANITVTNSYYSTQTIIGDQSRALGEFLVSWAVEGVISAVDKGFVPDDIQSDFPKTITRAEFCRMAVKWLEYRLGKNIDAIVVENGDPAKIGHTFSDTTDLAILAAYRLGIIGGTVAPADGKPGIFNPNGQFTREQAATMIRNVCRAAGMDISNTASAGFNDINTASDWARDAIHYVRNAGIMSGTGTADNPLFSPKGNYTREQSIVTFNNIK
ncbi:MAG: S-layer homology domain-containing protein [Oscillospiraceae bacterium]|nr:S-layer homology domain-containing protein [Oscillospiraceae bacterium]